VDIYPQVRQTLSPPPDCAVSFHVTNQFLAKTVGGGPALVITVNGVPLAPLDRTLATARRLVDWRAAVTVEAIQRTLGRQR